MRKFLLPRVFYSIITLWLLTSIVFGLVRLTGDPVKMKAEAGADEAYMAQLRRDWGLDQPVYRQYISFLGNLVQGDFGHSFTKSLAVRTIYLERLPNSLKLGLAAFALGWFFSGAMLRITRSSMLEVIGSDYIKLVRLKGIPEWVVTVKHALKNSLIPILTLAGLNLLVMINVAVVVEVVFNWPGVGQLLYDALVNRDFPMVQGMVLMRRL